MIKKNIENDTKLEVLNSGDYGEIISNPKEIIKLQKQKLKEKQDAVKIMSDMQKIEEVMKVMNGISRLGDILTDEEVIQRIKDNTTDAKDLNFLADTYTKMLKALAIVKQCDTIDGDGTPKRVSLAVGFQGVKVGVQIEND